MGKNRTNQPVQNLIKVAKAYLEDGINIEHMAKTRDNQPVSGIIKDINDAIDNGEIHVGGEQPQLFAQNLSIIANKAYFSKNSKNGDFGTNKAFVDGVEVSNPLTITQELDQKEIRVVTSEDKFIDGVTTGTLEYISGSSTKSYIQVTDEDIIDEETYGYGGIDVLFHDFRTSGLFAPVLNGEVTTWKEFLCCGVDINNTEEQEIYFSIKVLQDCSISGAGTLMSFQWKRTNREAHPYPTSNATLNTTGVTYTADVEYYGGTKQGMMYLFENGELINSAGGTFSGLIPMHGNSSHTFLKDDFLTIKIVITKA